MPGPLNKNSNFSAPEYAFGIIKFHQRGKSTEDEFDIGPLSWVHKSGKKTMIYWPSANEAGDSKTLVKYITKQAVVDKESWEVFQITVIAKFALLGLASQRIEYVLIEWFGTDWMQDILAEWKRRERGSIPVPVKLAIIFYIMGHVWSEAHSLWSDGIGEYVADLWNLIDFGLALAWWIYNRSS